MRKDALKKFKKIFEQQRQSLLFNDKVLRDDFSVNGDDRFDELDQATSDIEQSMRMAPKDARILIALKQTAATTANGALREKVRVICEESLPALMTQSTEEMRLGLARYVLDATNNDEAVEALRDALMDCVELASATGL